MKLFRIITLAAVVLCFAACEKDPLEGGSDNWWYRNGFETAGIKTIEEDNLTTTFDQKGRPIATKSQYEETSITYNAEGLPSKIEIINYENGIVSDKTTQTFEYGNAGKFCPMAMGPGFVFHTFELGLVPGLSKIIWSTQSSGTITMDYKFNGDKLTIHTSGGNSGADYKDVVFEYKGAYPYQMNGEMEYLGPLTYQENGMFDVYVEGFIDTDSKVKTMERTKTVSKSFPNKMLPEKEVSKYYNAPEGTLYNTETITYTYNEHGDCTKEVVTNTCEHCDSVTTEVSYEYDSKGNWTKASSTSYLNGKQFNSYSRSRVITYY